MALTHEQILGIIKAHRHKAVQDYKKWDRWRAWYQSDWSNKSEEQPTGSGEAGDSDEVEFETNYPYAFVDTMIANVCPLNPQMTVNARREDLEPMAMGREALINHTFAKSRLHEKMWLCSTHASVYQRGFFKIVWDTVRKRPKFRVIDPRHVFFDMSAEDWDEIRYLVEVTVLTKDEFRSRAARAKKNGYSKKAVEDAVFKGYPEWLRDRHKDKSLLNEASKSVFEWVTVYEFYDFTDPDGKFFHILEDLEEPLYEGPLPYKHVRNPFRMLTFNESLDDIGGMSDVQLIESAQDQLNELDTLELNHAKSTIPMIFFHAGIVDNPEALMEAYRSGGQPGSFAVADMAKSHTIQDAIMVSPSPSLNPSFDQMRARCLETITFVLGIPEYSRGQIGGSDVATEVALADTATRTRNGRRQKRVYDVISWLGESVVALYEELMDGAERIYVRLVDKEEMVKVTRASMGLQDLKDQNAERVLDYDYEAVPYSSVENNRMVQLRNLQNSWEALLWGVQADTVDAQLLMKRLLDLLMIGNVSKKPNPAQLAQASQPQLKNGTNQLVGTTGIPVSQDTIQTGGLPDGAAPAIDPGAGVGPDGSPAPTAVLRGSAGIPG